MAHRASAKSTILHRYYTKTSHKSHSNRGAVAHASCRPIGSGRGYPAAARSSRRCVFCVVAERQIGRLAVEAVVESARGRRVARHRAAARGVGERPVVQRIVGELRGRFVTVGRVGPAPGGLEALREPLERRCRAPRRCAGAFVDRLLEQRDRLVAAARVRAHEARVLDRGERGRDRALVLRRHLGIALLVLGADLGGGGRDSRAPGPRSHPGCAPIAER